MLLQSKAYENCLRILNALGMTLTPFEEIKLRNEKL